MSFDTNEINDGDKIVGKSRIINSQLNRITCLRNFLFQIYIIYFGASHMSEISMLKQSSLR